MENTASEQTTEDYVDVETNDPQLSKAIDEFAVDFTIIEHSKEDYIKFKPLKVIFDAIGEFCFESDELALKGNNDYKNILEAIVILEAQRAKTVKDLRQLQKLKEEALSDPFEFLERMKNNENMFFPKPQKIYTVPVIDWGKYALSGNPTAFEQRQINLKRQMARGFAMKNSKKARLNQDINIPKEKEILQTWTENEVKQLKELFTEIPTAEEDSLRWEKIANMLGKPTPFEVAFWVHEHYDQLVENGSNNVGDKPNLDNLKKHWGLKDVDKESNVQDQQNGKEIAVETRIEISEDDEINPELHNTPEFQELVLLKKILREKVVEESSGLAQHIGYKCCRCKTEPMVGVRWHCTDCKPPSSVDFCEECAGSIYETKQHTADHHLEKQLVVKGFLDCDYMHFLGSDYNYLDPNYMPAT